MSNPLFSHRFARKPAPTFPHDALDRRVTQPPEEAAEGGKAFAAAAPVRLGLLDPHHVGDAAVEEGAGGGEAVAVVVEIDEAGRSVDAEQQGALAVVIEV